MAIKHDIERFGIVKEVWDYVRYRRMIWMGMIILLFAMLSIFIVLVEGSAIAPFIYALF